MTAALEARLHALYHSVEGIRRKPAYEHSYGLPLGQKLGFTPVNGWHSRILAELEFCLQLSRYGNVDTAAPMRRAMEVLEAGLAADGVLTDAVCRAAEQHLLPLAEEAKDYTLLLVGHAHLDMNWQWSWDETVATVVATFKTMLQLMEEYPDFCFSQSQASTYKIIEDYAPELMPKIRQRIREGRWEVTAAAWVETDKNMPCTESLLNHILYTKKYLREHWGIDPESLDLDFSPDTFGHSALLPELDALGNVKYYYHCRGMDDPEKILYRWRAPSGRELLMYKEPYWYNSGINPDPALGLPKTASLCGGLRTGMAVYGVGDHGGGPTRRDLNAAQEMMRWPVFPTVRFGTFHDYFREAEGVRDAVPVVEKELNAIFSGCYSTQSRIKRGNRRAETALIAAEGLCALSDRELGSGYEENAFETAWQNTLFTHFHDILTGSCVQDSREYAMGLYQQALSTAQTRSAFALEAIRNAIDTSAISVEEDTTHMLSQGAGVGFGLQSGRIPTQEQGSGKTRIFHIFNPTSTDRHGNAELTLWDWPGDPEQLVITDSNGKPLPFEKISDIKEYWAHRYFTLLVTVSVPAWGYTTLVLREKPARLSDPHYYTYGFDRQAHPFRETVLENRYLRAAFDRRTGALYSLVDKQTGMERLRPGETGGLRYVRTQRNDMSAWIIDRYLEVQPVTDLVAYKTVNSRLNPGIETEHRLLDSRITTTVTLGSEDRYLTVKLRIDWAQQGAHAEDQPVLTYCLPLAEPTGQLLCDIPGGAQWRQAQEMDLPCLRYGAAAMEDGRAVALASDCKYGFRLSGNDLSVTLINTAYLPDPYPERGIHEIKLFLLCTQADPAVLARETDICLNPLQYVPGTVHGGTLPAEASFLGIEGTSVTVSGIAQRGGMLALRLTEVCGKACPVRVKLRTPAKKAILCDLFGRETGGQVDISKNYVNLSLAPFTTAELRIE